MSHRPCDPDAVFDAVCEWYRVNTGEIVEDGRLYGRKLGAQRGIARYLREDGMSLPEIGRQLNRDHTSILYGLKVERSPIEEDIYTELKEFVECRVMESESN